MRHIGNSKDEEKTSQDIIVEKSKRPKIAVEEGKLKR